MSELPVVETTKNELKLILFNKDINEILINTYSLRISIKENYKNKKCKKKITRTTTIISSRLTYYCCKCKKM